MQEVGIELPAAGVEAEAECVQHRILQVGGDLTGTPPRRSVRCAVAQLEHHGVAHAGGDVAEGQVSRLVVGTDDCGMPYVGGEPVRLLR